MLPGNPGPRLVDLGNPVSGHPLNSGLELWWLPLPHNSGTGRLYDLTGGYHGDLLNGAGWAGGDDQAGFPVIVCDGTDDVVRANALPVSTTPLTLSCWVYPRSTASLQTVLGLVSTSSTQHYHILQLRGTAGVTVAAASQAGAGGAVVAETTSQYTTGVWQHVCAVFESATSRTAYLNGGSAGTNTTSRVPTVDRFSAGRFDSVTPGGPFQGRMTDVRVYSRALSAGEVYGLYRQGPGGSPDVLNRYTPRTWFVIQDETPLPALPQAPPAPGPRLVDLGNPVSDHPLNAGLVAWWLPLPHNSGTGRLYNIVRRPGCDGTLTNGPTWGSGPGRFPSLSFDGSDDYVNCGDPAAVDVGSSGYTWAAWVRPVFVPAISYGMIVGKDDNVSGRQFIWAYGTEGGITGLHFGMFSSDTAYYISRYSTASLNDGSWHYVTFRYSPGVGCYHSVDGVEATETTATQSVPGWSGTMRATAATLCIGQRTYSGFTNRWNGRIADVSMRLGGTVSYVRDLYNQARLDHPDTLRRYTPRTWGFGEEGVAPGGGNRRRRVLICGRV